MSARLPVFPLGTVLFPGLVLPLHIFEERYRTLIRHLVGLPDGSPREFGVVAIRSGWSGGLAGGGKGPGSAGPGPGGRGPIPGLALPGTTGPVGTGIGGAGGSGGAAGGGGGAAGGGAAGGPGTPEPGTGVTLYEVGCTAELRQVTELPDGRFDVVTVGRRRFRIIDVDERSMPYLTAEVDWLAEPPESDDVADLLAPRVLAVFRQYLALIRDDPEEISEQLPDDPTVLSHLVAATAALTLADRQRLLAIPDTAARLRAELRLLSREATLLRQVRAVPMPLGDLAAPPNPN